MFTPWTSKRRPCWFHSWIWSSACNTQLTLPWPAVCLPSPATVVRHHLHADELASGRDAGDRNQGVALQDGIVGRLVARFGSGDALSVRILRLPVTGDDP